MQAFENIFYILCSIYSYDKICFKVSSHDSRYNRLLPWNYGVTQIFWEDDVLKELGKM